jgi:hypothetical protein
MKYGTVDDNEKLKAAGLPVLSALELSHLAYRNMGDTSAGESPDEACIKRINGIKEEYGIGLSTSITLYNALGYPLAFRSIHNEQGRIWKYNCDDVIYNGEWACMLHVKPDHVAIGSHGAIVYNLVGSQTAFGEKIVMVIAWDNPYTGQNRGFCFFLGESDLTRVTLRQLWETSTKGSEDSHNDLGSLRARWTLSQGTAPIFRVIAAYGECFPS